MWQTLERTRTILQIIVALLALAGALSVWLQFSVPGWLAVLLAACGVGVGFLLGNRGRPSKAADVEPGPAVAINRIGFNYQDEPTNHGWRVTHDTEPERASAHFRLEDDPEVGRYASIETSRGTRVDYDLAPADCIVDALELEYRPESDSAFYVRLNAVGTGIEPEHHWLQYRVGRAEPTRFNDFEWVIPVQPSPILGRWLWLRCDLKKHFDLTFGQDGLRLDHISGFRIRGKMSIATIRLYKSSAPTPFKSPCTV